MVDTIQECSKIKHLDLEQEITNKIALKMLEERICCSVIARCTGLTKEEIKSLNNHKCSH